MFKTLSRESGIIFAALVLALGVLGFSVRPAAALKYAPVNNSAHLQPIPPLQGQPNVSGNVNFSEGTSTTTTPDTQKNPDAPRPENPDNQPQELDSFQQQIYQNLQDEVASQKQRDADAEDAAKAISNLRWILVALQASVVGIIYILYKVRGKALDNK